MAHGNPARQSRASVLAPLLAGFSPRDRIVFGLMAALIWLNVMDAVFTIAWVGMGVAEEANPLMKPLLDHSPWTFLVGKLGLIATALSFLWVQRKSKSVLVGLGISVAVYGSLLIYHLQISALVLSRELSGSQSLSSFLQSLI